MPTKYKHKYKILVSILARNLYTNQCLAKDTITSSLCRVIFILDSDTDWTAAR